MCGISRRYIVIGGERVSGVHDAGGGQRERSRQGSVPFRGYQFTRRQLPGVESCGRPSAISSSSTEHHDTYP